MSANLFEFKPSEISLGRKLNREGKSLQEVHDALGWTCNTRTTEERFKRIGIKLTRSPHRQRAHQGGLTRLSHGDAERIDASEG